MLIELTVAKLLIYRNFQMIDFLGLNKHEYLQNNKTALSVSMLFWITDFKVLWNNDLFSVNCICWHFQQNYFPHLWFVIERIPKGKNKTLVWRTYWLRSRHFLISFDNKYLILCHFRTWYWGIVVEKKMGSLFRKYGWSQVVEQGAETGDLQRWRHVYKNE